MPIAVRVSLAAGCQLLRANDHPCMRNSLCSEFMGHPANLLLACGRDGQGPITLMEPAPRILKAMLGLCDAILEGHQLSGDKPNSLGEGPQKSPSPEPFSSPLGIS